MSLLTEASLVITPNAVEEGKLFSIIPTDGSGDMTAVRATTATLVNSEGVIEDCPYNLLQRSQEFNNAYWGKVRTTIIQNSTIAPDGSLTADKLVDDTTALATHQIARNVAVVSGLHTMSIFAKKGEYNFIRFWEDVQTGNQCYFNLDTGVATNVDMFNVSIEEYSDGWFRCIATINIPSAGNFGFRINLTPNGTTVTYDGTGTNGVYIWGAQLVTGTQPKEYFPTTDRLNVPRLDYTNGSCPSILVEPLRTNVLTNSDGNLATYATNSNVTDAGVPINGFTNSIQFGDNSLIRSAYKRNFTPTIGVQYTLSVFIQMNDNSQPVLGLNATTGDFSLIINNSFGIINTTITKIGVTNLYRVSATHTATGTNTVFGLAKYTTQSTKGFKITGIQLEAGSSATSYIPTVASAVTRNADVISKTGISDLIGQTQGTIFIDLDWSGNLTLPSRLFQINNGTSSSDIFFNINATTGNIQLFINNLPKPLGTIISINAIKKLAFVYTTTSLKVYINGTLDINISESVTFALLDRLNIGSSNIASDRVANMRVNNFMIFKTALTNEQSINLTSI